MHESDAIVLRRDWEAISTQSRVHGATVFKELFREYPSYLSYFRARRMNKDGRDLSVRLTLLAHASSFMKGIEKILAVLDNVDELNACLRLIGADHASRNVQPQHICKLFPFLLEQLITVNVGCVHKASWERLFSYSKEKIIEGAKKPSPVQIGPKEDALRGLYDSWARSKDGTIRKHTLIMILQNLSPHKSTATKIELAIEENGCSDNTDLIDFEGFLAVFASKLS